MAISTGTRAWASAATAKSAVTSMLTAPNSRATAARSCHHRTKKGKAKLAAGEQSDEEEGDEEAAMALFAGSSKMVQLEAIMDPDALLKELKIQEEAAVTASTQLAQGFGRTTGHAAMARGTHAATMPLADVQPNSDEEEEDNDVEDEDSYSISADGDANMSSP